MLTIKAVTQDFTSQNSVVQALLIFCVFLILTFIIDKTLKKIASRYDASASELFNLISNSQKGILIFIACTLSLSKLGFNVGALIAGLGLTGFAVGFALKDAISNLVAGVMVVLYRPIQMGQLIEVMGSKGRVININLRYISIYADGLTHLIPNSLILSNKLTIIEEVKTVIEEDSTETSAENENKEEDEADSESTFDNEEKD